MDARSLSSDRALARARSLRSDRAEHAFGRCVATLFELLADDSRFLRKAFHFSCVVLLMRYDYFLTRYSDGRIVSEYVWRRGRILSLFLPVVQWRVVRSSQGVGEPLTPIWHDEESWMGVDSARRAFVIMTWRPMVSTNFFLVYREGRQRRVASFE
ncbi:hypothetical protein F2Q69_00029836 [Brassica cretica]|uniref:Uncharacterized protein n=1 Tax=Brassica cretica TaxID=69181 RepID=A0A8S9RSD8_BRACR|nr:hypothetical protein F2Q69_00029836 [Brassica cretica]